MLFFRFFFFFFSVSPEQADWQSGSANFIPRLSPLTCDVDVESWPIDLDVTLMDNYSVVRVPIL